MQKGCRGFMKYRKKPVVIEAFQITEEIYSKLIDYFDWEDLDGQWLKHELPQFLIDALNKESLPPETGAFYSTQESCSALWIYTLEGSHEVSPNDWIIKGIKGELYPCKPDIFEQTYEAVAGE